MADLGLTSSLTAGQTNVDGPDFNSIVTGAVIQPAFVSGKTAVVPDQANDYVLGWDATDSALKKFLVSNLLAIDSQTDMAAIPAGADTVLVYDDDVAAIRKVTYSNLVPVDDSSLERDSGTRQLQVKALGVTAAMLAGTLDLSSKTLTLPSGPGQVLAANLETPLDLSSHSVTLANGEVGAAELDQAWIDGLTNKATPTGTDKVAIADQADSGNLKEISLTSIASLSAAPLFSSTGNAVTGSGLLVDTAHSLGRAPYRVEAFLVCTSTDAGYAVGDMVNVQSFQMEGTGHFSAFTYGGNTTNIIATKAVGATLWTVSKSGTSRTAWDDSKWTLSLYAW